MIDPQQLDFLWVVDFPLFLPREDGGEFMPHVVQKGERGVRRKTKRSVIFLEGTGKGHRQSDQH